MSQDKVVREIVDAKKKLMEASFSLWNSRLEAAGGDPEEVMKVLGGGESQHWANDNCKGANCAKGCNNLPLIDLTE